MKYMEEIAPLYQRELVDTLCREIDSTGQALYKIALLSTMHFILGKEKFPAASEFREMVRKVHMDIENQ
jgi:hypothetical protein